MTRVLGLMLSLAAAPAFAQSPNTAGLVVIVVDQTNAVVPGAHVSLTNVATGDLREATSGSDGSITLAAVPMTGSYVVRVTKPGFSTEDVRDIVLRAGETATARVRLTATGGTSEIAP